MNPTTASSTSGTAAHAGGGADFMLACGPVPLDLLTKPPGDFTRIAAPAGMCAFARGDVRHDTLVQGGSVSIADLVSGDLTAMREGAPDPAAWRGRFCHVQWDADGRHLRATTDHFASLPLYVRADNDGIAIATDLRLLLAAPACRREIDLAAIYHYLNFGCIPAPHTICRGIARIEPGTQITWADGKLRAQRWYVPDYAQDLAGGDATLAARLLDRIQASVRDYRPHTPNGWGCFLSGGTDSSSIVSLLARASGTSVDTFSIGFAEPGYDELGFARLAAQSCGARPYTDLVTSARALELLGTVVSAWDQPFGNASAVPTLACAELARANGVNLLLAGDGGDEIFGGNARYAKDRVMEAYYRLPSPLRALGNAIGHAAGRRHSHLLQRIGNFTERASLPNPDRFYSDDSFASDYYDDLLTADFRDAVSREASLEHMRQVYAQGSDATALHRIMRLDLLHAIAQNDLVKVHGACKARGVSVRFPYLDPELVAFAGRLPERHKVRGLDKRHLFKLAMRGVLPEQILRKKKQGFGLPIAVWLRTDPAFGDFIRGVLGDRRTRERGWFMPACIERLLAEHARGSWDHSAAIWQFVVLELWLREHFDGA